MNLSLELFYISLNIHKRDIIWSGEANNWDIKPCYAKIMRNIPRNKGKFRNKTYTICREWNKFLGIEDYIKYVTL